MARKKRKPRAKSAAEPLQPPPDNPLLRQRETEPTPERAKQMAEARLDAMRKLGLIKK
jgi:hypothetical protein